METPRATNLTGGCNCGAVRFRTAGSPIRAGLCHCQTCRRETGSAFMAYAVWRMSDVTITGETRHWRSASDERHFCTACGSTLFATNDAKAEIEIRIGCLDDAPTALTPAEELWTVRREPWLPAFPAATQHSRNRT